MPNDSAVCADFSTGNDVLILHEIRHALKKLLDSDEATTIDLRAMPLASGEEERLVNQLGKGEISVHLDALGVTEMQETAVTGSWLITHYDTEGKVQSKFIEITRVPSLVASQTEDIEQGIKQLEEQLK